MAIKKKVTYSVSYVEGTDTLTTKLSSLLQDIVTLILSQNPGLTVLDTITVGSERFTGAPLYDTYVSGLYSPDYNNRHYESDVVFIGTNEDNICLSLGFFDGNLIVAMNMTPKVEKEYTDNWAAMGGGSWLPFYAIGKASRWFPDLAGMLGNYALPYTIANNIISMSVIYWHGDYSSGYSFMNGAQQSDGVDLIIFPTDEGNNTSGLGAAMWPYGTVNAYRNGLSPVISIFSFAENLSNNKPESLNTQSIYKYPPIYSSAVMQQVNARYDWRSWFNVRNSESDMAISDKLFATMHTLGGDNGRMEGPTQRKFAYPIEQLKINLTWDCDQPDTFLSALIMSYNLPYLTPGTAYVRKMRIPGWNPACKGEIYLLWSPVVSAYQSGDIVEVGSKSYAIITEGAVVWAARVS